MAFIVDHRQDTSSRAAAEARGTARVVLRARIALQKAKVRGTSEIRAFCHSSRKRAFMPAYLLTEEIPAGFRVATSPSILVEVLGVDARIAVVLLDRLEARPRLAADEERLRASGEER
jgi:hypothetical protein